MIPRPFVPLILFALFPPVLAASCATTAPAAEPSLHSESSSGAIRAAEEVGAARTPSAALHLQLAKEEFDQARKTTDPMDRDRADRLLMRAQVDAELSLVLARSEADKVEAQQAIDKVKALKATTVQ
jgi:Domain of unknown function (DUF4398)